MRLQKSEPGTGRTDIEVETELLRLVIEAKRGWQLPQGTQLQKYAARLNAGDTCQGHIAVVAECAPHFPPRASLPRELDGIPCQLRAMVTRGKTGSRRRECRSASATKASAT